MTRLVREPATRAPERPPARGAGIVFGLAALTRNEFLWLGLVWVVLAWRPPVPGRVERIRLSSSPALIGFVILAPWLVRDWVVFGNPLPGQAATNALSVTGFDIFAWQDPPTLARYLGEGPAWLLTSRIEGFAHNLFEVLLVPGAPVSLLGLVALPWVGRRVGPQAGRLAERPDVRRHDPPVPRLDNVGHVPPRRRAGPRPAHRQRPARPSTGSSSGRARGAAGRSRSPGSAPTLTVSAAILFSVGILAYGAQARDTQRRYAALVPAMAAAGLTVDPAVPVITDFPIWYAEGTGGRALALPDERPASILDLAKHFGAQLLVLTDKGHGRWPAVIDAGGPDVACFHEVVLPVPSLAADAAVLHDARVFRVGCP